jgi:predicted oxidoreductase
MNVEETFVSVIEEMSHMYEKVILLGGIHLDEYFRPNDVKLSIFAYDMNYIMNKNKNIFLCLDEPDLHIVLMHKASNLLLHKGGFSCIGSLICEGKIFITNHFSYDRHPHWKEYNGNRKYNLIREP